MRAPRIVIPKPADPLAAEIASRLALKRLQAQRAERARTAPVAQSDRTAPIVLLAVEQGWDAAYLMEVA